MSDSKAKQFVEITLDAPAHEKNEDGSVIDQEKWSQRVLFKMYINYVVGNDIVPSWQDFLSFEEEMKRG